MASPQLEKGFTKIANEILEHLSFAGINGSEYRILLVVIRKTYGFNKLKDKISISQFQKFTIMEHKHAVKTIKSLVDKRILLKDGNTYKFNKNWEEWVVDKRTPQCTNAHYPSGQTYPKSSVQMPTHKRKKETNTKEIAETSSAGVIQIIDSFKDINPAFNSWYGNKTQRAAAKWLLDNFGLEETLTKISYLSKLNALPYAPITTTPYQLQTNIAKIRAFVQQNKNKSKAQSRGLEV